MILLFLLWAQAAPATASDPIDRLFAAYAQTRGPGCTVGVAREGRTVRLSAYGMADLEHGLALTPASVLEAGSVSKQFTAAAVLLLARDGKLSLDDPVRRYIPELDEAAQGVTIRHMLSHTAGLRDWGNLAAIAGWPRGRRAHTHAHVLEILARQRALNYTPGAEYSYSNSGYNLAAILVSRVAQMPFAEFSRQRLFGPLGLEHTQWRDDFTRVVPGRAIAYSEGRQDMPFENVHGNGGLLTTVADLLRWNQTFAHFDELARTARLNDGRELSYALGLRVEVRRGVKEISHSGATAGYRAWLARYPEHGALSVAVLCNAGEADAPGLGRQVAAIYLKDQLKAAPPRVRTTAEQAGLYRSLRDHHPRTWAAGALLPEGSEFRGTRVRIGAEADGGEWFERVEPVAALTEEQAQAYAGVYDSEEAETRLRVTWENGRLMARRRPDTAFELKPAYRDAFTGGGSSIRFLRESGGRVHGLALGQSRVWDLRFRKVTPPAVIP